MSGDRARPRNDPGGDPGDPPRDLPGLALAGQLTAAAGPRERYAGHGDDAVMVAAGRRDALESWAYGRKLAAARELVRRRPAAGAATRIPGGTPSAWRKDLGAEIACELAVTTHAAETLAGLAVVLETRLPLTAAALDAGILNASKARLIADETAVLTDEQARAAEAEIAGKWPGRPGRGSGT